MHTFPQVADLMIYAPLPTRHGLRLLAKVREPRNIAIETQNTYPFNTKALSVLNEEGHVQTQLKGPPDADTSLAAVNRDGSRLATFWIGPKTGLFTLYDAGTGEPVVSSVQEIGNAFALAFSPDGRALLPAPKMA